MTNCIKQITSCTIENKSQRCSCAITEIIAPKHFIPIPPPVYTLLSPYTPQECSYEQQGLQQRQTPGGKPRFPAPNLDSSSRLRLGLIGQEERQSKLVLRTCFSLCSSSGGVPGELCQIYTIAQGRRLAMFKPEG